MRRMTYPALLLAFVLVCASARSGAADAVIRGVVTDSAGKPIAGALVKANVGPKSTSRYTAADGRYELSVPPGKYELVVEAFGFGGERRSIAAPQPDSTNFALTQRWSVTQFTGADIDQLIPDDPPAQMLKSMCINCHALDVMLRRRGATAAQWRLGAATLDPLPLPY